MEKVFDDGSKLTCSVTAVPFRDKKGSIVGVVESYTDITERRRFEREKEGILSKLREENKELNCLYKVSQISERANIEEVYTGILNVIPEGWQYPEITCVRLTIGEEEYKTENFRESEWRISEYIEFDNEVQGSLEVFYLEERPDDYEGPFSREERKLINKLSSKLGELIDRREKGSEIKVEGEKAASYSSSEPGVPLSKLEEEKDIMRESIAINVEKNIKPLLKKLRKKDSDPVKANTYDMIEKSLNEINNEFYRKMSNFKYRLSPTELRVCQLVKSGLLIREVAEMLDITFFTAKTHIRNIKKKMGINNSKMALKTYLKNIV